MPGFITTHKMRLHLGQVPPGRILIQVLSFLSGAASEESVAAAGFNSTGNQTSRELLQAQPMLMCIMESADVVHIHVYRPTRHSYNFL